VIELDEPHRALCEAARHQAVGGEGARTPRVPAVQLERARRFVGEIADLLAVFAAHHFALEQSAVYGMEPANARWREWGCGT
jgi:hypothetical protein